MADPAAVLVVEDESIVAHDLQHTLGELGYDAFAIAASAEEAMARAIERRPDLALVDIRIKGKLDGIQAAQLLQERFGLPIVYLTAHADDATLERATQTGPYGYLVKPVMPAELRSTIEVALQRHRMDQRQASAAVAAPAPTPRDVRAPGGRAVRRQLAQVLTSADFDASRRSREFLSFIVEEALAGRGAALSQSMIAMRVFGRRDDFDAVVDPIVRIQAGRLRRSLERYYLLAGRKDPVRIDLPRGAYVPTFHRTNTAEAEPATAKTEVATEPAMENWPGVVVRQFEAVGEPELDSLTARFNEELAAELGRYRELRVVRQGDLDAVPVSQAPELFALSGTLRATEGGLGVGARLLDAATGEQLWMDTYYTALKRGRRGGSLEDVARVIAARVGSEEGLVAQRLAGELRQGKQVGPAAYVAILRSYEFHLAPDIGSFPGVLDTLRQVVIDVPESSLAWARLARLYLANHAFEIAKIDTPLEKALAYAQTGVRLDPTSRRARCVLAAVWLVEGELAAARDEAERALRLTTDSLVYLEIIGWLLTLAGDWERGAALASEAAERNPHHLPYGNYALWANYLRCGEYAAAYEVALSYRDATFFWRALMRAACLGHLGRPQDAQRDVAELLQQKPDFPSRGRTLIGRLIKFEDVQERIADGLRRADLRLD